MNATMFQTSLSSWVTPNDGIPVILTLCLTIQNNSRGVHALTASERSGACGFSPLPISVRSRPRATMTDGAHIIIVSEAVPDHVISEGRRFRNTAGHHDDGMFHGRAKKR